MFAVHGWLDNAGTFDALVPLLPPDLRIVCVDLPGHGLSDHYPPDVTYNFLDCLPAVERLARHFGWSRFSFLGHSLGGTMAVLYAGVYPEKVAQYSINQSIDQSFRETLPSATNEDSVGLWKFWKSTGGPADPAGHCARPDDETGRNGQTPAPHHRNAAAHRIRCSILL